MSIVFSSLGSLTCLTTVSNLIERSVWQETTFDFNELLWISKRKAWIGWKSNDFLNDNEKRFDDRAWNVERISKRLRRNLEFLKRSLMFDWTEIKFNTRESDSRVDAMQRAYD